MASPTCGTITEFGAGATDVERSGRKFAGAIIIHWSYSDLLDALLDGASRTS